MARLFTRYIFLAVFSVSAITVHGFPNLGSIWSSFKSGVQPRYGNIEERGDHFEGDIVRTPEEAGMAKSGIRDTKYRWPNATIPYIFSNTFSQRNRDIVKDAIQVLQDNTCIQFVPRTTQSDYVEVTNTGLGCYSNVGRVGGAQRINLAEGCLGRVGTIQHEFIHALGFYHEQSRSDRDDHVYIIWLNIIPLYITNFFAQSNDNNFGVEYDYGSVMHYSERAFSWNGLPTIWPVKWGAKIGQRDGPSKKDLLKLNRMYGCNTA